MATANEIAILVATLAQLAERLATSEPETGRPEPRPMPPRVLFTMEEAAEQLRIGRTNAYRLVRTGELESVQIGRRRLVHVDAIKDYAARLVAEASRKNAA
ncbi:helix-turn-helix domain-containing protein [Amycolatopsis sp. CA-128772]|uniref:helix-turn-helix domain-containing protein n=1 Tax=Amycolatopsis sp. CA-128772 TaxID=2073159 RepID=UPI000CD0AE2B|nr:helix-turn-helix domain-containing protein [Amycolatopsis sp. CA-128772]